MNSTNRVISNTAVLYVCLLIKMAVGIFTVRYVLEGLGETDYGVYVAVAGVVALLDILNANMTNTSMRYLARSLGSSDKEIMIKTFNTTLIIHYIIGVITIILLEVGGWLMFEYVLKIPIERMFAAKVVFQFMVATTFITIVAVPYDAVMNAHEKIWLISIIDIIGVVSMFVCSIWMLHYNGDRLIFYGLYLLIINIVLRVIKVSIAKRLFEESRYVSRKYYDRTIFKSILSFTGWNLFSSLSSTGSKQLQSLLINVFFGVKLNAAEGISRRINNYVNMVSASMTKSINPQIMKSEGGGNREKMLHLTAIASKYSSFLFALIGVPLAIETPYILNVWLSDVPEYAVIFCQLSLINMLIAKFSFQITQAIMAVGKIRDFQIVESLFYLIPVLISYMIFKLGYPPQSTYYIALIMTIPITLFRLYFGKKIACLNIGHFIKNAILPSVVPVVIASMAAGIIHCLMAGGLSRFIISVTVFELIFIGTFWYIGLSREERSKWLAIVKNVIIKKKKTDVDL